MSKLELCFFCCEIISQENSNCDKSVDLSSFASDTSKSRFPDYKATEDIVIRISHYLKIPRTIIGQNYEQTSSIKTCSACTIISKNLSDHCSQLEIVQMKINYYLSQLTNRIIGLSGDNQEKPEVPPNRSNFQKIVHKKCLLTTQKAEESSVPKISIQKCPNPAPDLPVQDLKSEPMTEYPVILEEVDLDSQLETKDDLKEPVVSTINELSDELHSCPFCTFAINGSYYELHCHISTDHPEQFESDDEDPSSISLKNQNVRQSNASEITVEDKSGPIKCYTCGKHFTKARFKKHLRRSIHCAQNFGKQESIEGNFECSNCKRRYTRPFYLRHHIKTICKTGVVIDLRRKTEKNMKRKRIHKYTKCEQCGVLVYQKGLKKHIENNHNIGDHSNTWVKRYNCTICNVMFGKQKILRKHMQAVHPNIFVENSEKCEGDGNKCKVEESNQVEGQKNYEDEPVLVLSIPVVDEDANTVTDGNQMTIDEDPLQM